MRSGRARAYGNESYFGDHPRHPLACDWACCPPSRSNSGCSRPWGLWECAELGIRTGSCGVLTDRNVPVARGRPTVGGYGTPVGRPPTGDGGSTSARSQRSMRPTALAPHALPGRRQGGAPRGWPPLPGSTHRFVCDCGYVCAARPLASFPLTRPPWRLTGCGPNDYAPPRFGVADGAVEKALRPVAVHNDAALALTVRSLCPIPTDVPVEGFELPSRQTATPPHAFAGVAKASAPAQQ